MMICKEELWLIDCQCMSLSITLLKYDNLSSIYRDISVRPKTRPNSVLQRELDDDIPSQVDDELKDQMAVAGKTNITHTLESDFTLSFLFHTA